MHRRTSILILYIALTALCQAHSYANPTRSPTVRIDVRHPDETIRAQLLGYTPLGSDAKVVLEFVHTRLYCEGFASTIGVMPKPGISVSLGNYYGGVFSRVAVDADWQFDGGRKLRNIGVQQSRAKGGPFPAVDPTVTPKVRIDLRQPDWAIRAQLLESTPLGSPMAEVDRFIALQLYSQSGIASGIALTEKAGTGVILGEYGNEAHASSARTSVRAVWSFSADGSLKDIYIRRVKLQIERR